MYRFVGLLAFATVVSGCGASARPVTDMKIGITPERQARGEYLARHVLGLK